VQRTARTLKGCTRSPEGPHYPTGSAGLQACFVTETLRSVNRSVKRLVTEHVDMVASR